MGITPRRPGVYVFDPLQHDDTRQCKWLLIDFTLTDLQNSSQVLEVIAKTLPFHASTNYQLQAPKPYDQDVHWDLLKGLENIKSRDYASDFDFHRDVQQSLKRVNDGHLMYANWCYDSSYVHMLFCSVDDHSFARAGVYITYNPFPLVLLTDAIEKTQGIYIAPLAHEIAFALFGGQTKFWEDALGKSLQEVSSLNFPM